MVDHREKFQRYYDLTENVLPSNVHKSEPTEEERKRFFVLAVAGKDEREAETVLSSIPRRLEDINLLLNRELSRRRDLLGRFRERHRDAGMKDWLRWLVLATDYFIGYQNS